MMMLKKTSLLLAVVLTAGLLTSAQGPRPFGAAQGRRVALGRWPEARGRNRDGGSQETGLADKWALNGQNFLWRVPYGGRSAPIVMGNRVYVQNPAGRGPAMQERVMALDADTGKVVWEYKFNIFQSDVPPHRVGWASPAADPETGNIYALGVGALVVALNKDGKLLWERSVGEEFAAFTTHGGRAINTGVAVAGSSVIVSHGDENLDSSELGMIAAIDGSQAGDIKTTKWAVKGDQFGFSSPVIDGARVYQVENGSRLKAFDLETGRELWRQNLGTVQKAPLVLADGKLYVGTESGKFFIVRPLADRAEVLSEVELPKSL